MVALPVQHLVDELWSASTPSTRCPHLNRDAQGCVCCSLGCLDAIRRLVAHHLSLQLWCLDAERFDKCLFYSPGIQEMGP